jgi:hypothetical protein
MTDPGPGGLEGAVGIAERDGAVAASVELRDSRVQTYIEVPMAGGEKGKKPGRIEGFVAVRFAEVEDASLRDHLGDVSARRRRKVDLDFDLVLESGETLEGCRVGGPLGSENGAFWFVLEL